MLPHLELDLCDVWFLVISDLEKDLFEYFLLVEVDFKSLLQSILNIFVFEVLISIVLT